MKPKRFPDPIFSAIQRALEQEMKVHPKPIAAFDADGTLWNVDLGESFFQYQIQNKLLQNLPQDPWNHYHEMKKIGGNPRPAYLWLAQINRGVPIQQVRKWATDCVQRMQPLPIFEEQRHLIEWLLSQGVQVYVVTASVKWAVEPGAKLLGIPEENVLGVASVIENGLVSDRQEGLITYREGKAEALLHRTSGQKPFLACGNTTGDLFLLRAASQISLAVRAAPPGSELFETENSLFQEALKMGWQHFQFS